MRSETPDQRGGVYWVPDRLLTLPPDYDREAAPAACCRGDQRRCRERESGLADRSGGTLLKRVLPQDPVLRETQQLRIPIILTEGHTKPIRDELLTSRKYLHFFEKILRTRRK